MKLLFWLIAVLCFPAQAADYYTHGSFPATGATITSAAFRAEFDAIQAGFAKLPTFSGNGSKICRVNSGATAIEAVALSSLGLAGTDIANTGAGGISSVTVQAAINELDTEKANLLSPTFTTPNLGTPSAVVLTNATGTAASLTVGTATVANGLKSATTTVSVSAATAPSANQILTATNSTTATWVSPKVNAVRVSTQFDKTSSTTLADVTGLTVALDAATSYTFRAILYVDAGATGGTDVAIASSGSVTSIIFSLKLVDDTTDAFVNVTRRTGSGQDASNAGVTAGTWLIEGHILTNSAGNLTVQFAQKVSNGTASSVLVGSHLIVTKTD